MRRLQAARDEDAAAASVPAPIPTPAQSADAAVAPDDGGEAVEEEACGNAWTFCGLSAQARSVKNSALCREACF